MSILYYKDKNWDYVVMEAGIGGSHSQTNFLDSDYAVIASIGFDHMDLLGNTEEEIWRNKWGIIRDWIPVVIGPQVPVDVVQEYWDKHKAKLIRIEPEDNQTFMRINQAISLAVYNEIASNESKIERLSDEEIQSTLESSPPWRCQLISQENVENLCPGLSTYPMKVYMDVGHNEPALRNLIKTIKIKHGDDARIFIVCTFSSNKDILASFKILTENTLDIRIVIADHYRLIKVKEAIDLIRCFKDTKYLNQERLHELEFDGDLKENTIATLKKINEMNDSDAILILWGSVFLMEFVRDLFSIPQQKDF